MDVNQIFEELINKAKKKGNLDFFKSKTPAYAILHTALAKEMTKYLDYIGIPYTRFSIKDKKNDLIIFGQKNFENMIEIEKGTRIRMGLEIQSKEDLKMAIYENNKLTGKRDSLSNIKGLSEYEAKRICELMEKEHLVAVYKMYPDFSFEVSTHKKNKIKLQELLLQAILEELSGSEQVDTRKTLYSQEYKINEIFKQVENGELRSSYKVASGINQNTYVEINYNGLSYYENNVLRFSQPITDTFKERLNITLSLIDYPVVLPMQDIESLADAINRLTDDKEFSVKATELMNNSSMQDGVLFIQDNETIVPSDEINDILSGIEFFDENAGVTLDYMLQSDYGYDLNAAIEIANGKYIVLTDKTENDTKTVDIHDEREVSEETKSDIEKTRIQEER